MSQAELEQVRLRFPYMFCGDQSRVDVAPGWVRVFKQACVEIDAILGDDKRGFHWTEAKEKAGFARFRGKLVFDGRTMPGVGRDLTPAEADLVELVTAARHKAEDATKTVCNVCGDHLPQRETDGGYERLCALHAVTRTKKDESNRP